MNFKHQIIDYYIFFFINFNLYCILFKKALIVHIISALKVKKITEQILYIITKSQNIYPKV